jgi:hypothetical protein
VGGPGRRVRGHRSRGLPRTARRPDRLQAPDGEAARGARGGTARLGSGLRHRLGQPRADRRPRHDRRPPPGRPGRAGPAPGPPGCGPAGRQARLHRLPVACPHGGQGRPALSLGSGRLGDRQGIPRHPDGRTRGAASRLRVRRQRRLPGSGPPGGPGDPRPHRVPPPLLVLPRRPPAMAPPAHPPPGHRGPANAAVTRRGTASRSAGRRFPARAGHRSGCS